MTLTAGSAAVAPAIVFGDGRLARVVEDGCDPRVSTDGVEVGVTLGTVKLLQSSRGSNA